MLKEREILKIKKVLSKDEIKIRDDCGNETA